MTSARRWTAWLGGMAVLVIACILYLPNLGAVRGAIWDESYYLTAIQRQVEHHAQFASHPPLGFILLAAGARASGDDGLIAPRIGDEKKVAGDAIPDDYPYGDARLASAIAGMASAGAFYVLMLLLTGRVGLAVPLSNLFLFEPAFIVQFRAAQLDAFLMLFSVLGLAAIVWARKTTRHRAAAEVLFGVAVGLATMVKLAGVLLAIAGPLLLINRLWRSRPQTGAEGAARTVKPVRAAVLSALVMLTGFALAILAVYAIQLADGYRVPAQTAAGQRDTAFLSAPYRGYLEGEGSLVAALPAAVADGFRYMGSDFEETPKTDANGSRPHEWPLMQRTITYRWDSDGRTTRYVALVGNPIGWFLGLAGIAVALFTVLRRRGDDRSLFVGLLALWAAMMLAYVWLGRSRVLYLYHYFPVLIVSWAMLAAWLGSTTVFKRVSPRRLAVGVLALHLVAFVWLAPFAYSQPVTNEGCRMRAVAFSHPICRKQP